MGLNGIKVGRITAEIRVLNPDKLLNVIWSQGIKIYKVKKKNISTLILDIEYMDYDRLCNVVNSFGGKISIKKRKGLVFNLKLLKSQFSLVVGLGVFLIMLFGLSQFIWAIDISVQKNISPFEIRQQLSEFGIKPGITKRSIEVEEVEKRLENINNEILWLRVRIEGSTLKVVIEEKINPPSEWGGQYGNLVAKEDGEIKNIYTYRGRPSVKQGQIVQKDDILIEGIDGKEGQEYIIPPRGVVIANTFHEKSMKVQMTGTKLERSGRVDKEFYIQLFGKKLYLKKAIKDFQHYDRIEKSGKIFNEVVYYERIEKEVELSMEEAETQAVEKLEQSLKSELTRDAKISDKIIQKKEDEKGNLTISVNFVVERNIVNDIPVQY